MAGTVVVDARVRLVEILSSGVLPGVKVHYSHPGLELLGDEAIWFEPARVPNIISPTLKATKIRREEVILQPMGIAVLGAGMTQQQADERCVEILGIVEDTMALTANVTLSGAALASTQQVIHCLLRSWEQIDGPYEGGNGSGIRAEFETKARSL